MYWSFGMMIGVAIGLGVGVAISLTLSIPYGVAYGTVYGIMGGALSGIMCGVVGGVMGGALLTTIPVAATVCTELGIALSLPVRIVIWLSNFVKRWVWFIIPAYFIVLVMSGSVFAGMRFALVIIVIFLIFGGVEESIGIGLMMLCPLLVFYSFLCILARYSKLLGIRHPLEWWEGVVWLLPLTKKLLVRKLQQDQEMGLHFIGDLARNPFQRWAAQAVLYRYLHAHPNPLLFLYMLLGYPQLDEYASVPMRKKDWGHTTTPRHLLLGTLILQFVEPRYKLRIFSDAIVCGLTLSLYERRRTSLTDFARMLYELLDKETIEVKKFTLKSYRKIYTNLLAYPGGKEIAGTFKAMAAFLSYKNLRSLPRSAEIVSNLVFEYPIRPTVLTALNRLGEVGAEIATYQDSRSRAVQLAALVRATDVLKDLKEYVQAEVMIPEQFLLQRIIRQWRHLIINRAEGKLRRAEEVGLVEDPYVAGIPVTGELFVGREDILRRLEDLWSGTGQKPSIVLYGHRRMGKSSILHNLGAYFGNDTVIVDFNMQRMRLVASTGELLYNLALAIYNSIVGETPPYPPSRGELKGGVPQGGNEPTPDPSQEGNAGETPALPGEPEEEWFTAHSPCIAFNWFLKQIDRVRGGRRFIVAVDEFELIEQKIKEGKLAAQLLDFWQGVIQTYPWFVMVFAESHTLEEMQWGYWHPLFSSVTAIPVSFLDDSAAKRLITHPKADFDIDYDLDAVERIIALTHGQPYLIQLICHCLVSRFNRQSFEEGAERERRFRLSDVEAVISTPEFFRDAYFIGVWRQVKTSLPTGQLEILRALAQSETGIVTEELAQQTDFALEYIQRALDVLKRHDVVIEKEGSWQFTVELMRRWVAQKSYLGR